VLIVDTVLNTLLTVSITSFCYYSAIKAQGQEVVAVEESLSWLSYPLNKSKFQSSPEISRCNAITCTAMQNLESQIWKSRISISTKLKLYNTCILPIFLYGSECWAVTKRDVHKIDALNHWCLRKLLGIKRNHHVRNDDVRQKTEQPHLSATVQPQRLSMFGNTVQMPDESDAKQILTASPLENWRRPPGCPHTMSMKTTQQELKSLNLSLNVANDMAQNRVCLVLHSHSGACQK